ncbi:MAG: hypothetical protein E6K85_09080 [Thaumarchaeota archaeon]|nr:MAG: hypothetical protein E6K85_09080 [Nitrososphaerota archaeon]
MTSPENVLVHEIIGLAAKIVESADPTLEDVSGSIVSETKNMISIRTDSLVKKIAIKTYFGDCFISGSSLIGRPEDRISRLHN